MALPYRIKQLGIQAKFMLGIRPSFASIPDVVYPEGKRGALILNADFELAWAWMWAKGFPAPHTDAGQWGLAKAKQDRLNVPKMLELLDQYGVPCTWATVGALFHTADSFSKAAENMPWPSPFESKYWHFDGQHWLERYKKYVLGNEELWHAPDLIKAIQATKTKHEIGSHTFTHIDSSDRFSDDVFRADIEACKAAAASFGVDLKSYVFPANEEGHKQELARQGFSGYRCERGYEVDIPAQDENGLLKLSHGIFFECPSTWKPKFFARIVTEAIDTAILRRLPLSLWFHPSCDPINLTEVWPRVLEHAQKRSDAGQLWLGTMDGLAKTFAENPQYLKPKEVNYGERLA